MKMKWTSLICATILMGTMACNNAATTETEPAPEQTEQTQPTHKPPVESPNAPDVVEYVDGIPSMIHKAMGSNWRYQKRLDNGLTYIELVYHKEFFEMRSQSPKNKMDTFQYECVGDTIFPYTIEPDGSRKETPDCFRIMRVTNSSMDLHHIFRNNRRKANLYLFEKLK